jgi:hypothetical protein
VIAQRKGIYPKLIERKFHSSGVVVTELVYIDLYPKVSLTYPIVPYGEGKYGY